MTETEIKNKVNEVFHETDLVSTPIQIVAIANFYGFKVYQMSMDDNVSGMILSDEKNIKNFDHNKIIVINANHSDTRKRFTIAHELGHYILQNKPNSCYAHRDLGSYDSDEKNANSFASALLMPEKDVLNQVKALKQQSPHINDFSLTSIIANTFDVSFSAAQVRLKKLNCI